MKWQSLIKFLDNSDHVIYLENSQCYFTGLSERAKMPVNLNFHELENLSNYNEINLINLFGFLFRIIIKPNETKSKVSFEIQKIFKISRPDILEGTLDNL